jgi:hypothetical protein
MSLRWIRPPSARSLKAFSLSEAAFSMDLATRAIDFSVRSALSSDLVAIVS